MEGAYESANNEMKLIKSNPLLLALCGFGLLASVPRLTQYHDLAASAVEGTPILLRTFTFYLISGSFILQDRKLTALGRWIVVYFVFLLRSPLLPMLPSLSKNLYRYRREWRAPPAGGRPCQANPEEERRRVLQQAACPMFDGTNIRFWKHVLLFEVPAVPAGDNGGVAKLLSLGLLAARRMEPTRDVFAFTLVMLMDSANAHPW